MAAYRLAETCNALASSWLVRLRGNERIYVMTIAIQEIATRQFLAGEDEWVRDPQEALAFSDTRHALQYCRRHQLQNVRLVVFFRDKKVSLLLYVPGSNTPAPAGETRSPVLVGAMR